MTVMRPGALPLLAGMALVMLAAPASALTFAEAFDSARATDPQFQAAGFDLDAARQGVPIARASLLPNLQLQVSRAEVGGTREFPNALNQDVTVRVDYNSPQSTLALRAPIFNAEGLSRYRQAEAVSRGAEAAFRGRELALVDRLGTAYVQALVARSALAVSEIEVSSAQALLTRAEQRFKRGEGTRTDEAQSKAGLELARTRLVDARDQFALALVKLRRMTGRPVPELRELGKDDAPMMVAMEPLQHWLDLARDQNPALQARRESVEAARSNIKRNAAGHLPRLDLVASLARSRNESLSNLNQSSTLKTVGVQLNVPLFSGGGVSASVRQAEAEASRTEQELRAEIENVELEVQRIHVVLANGPTRIAAYRQLVAANEVALLGMSRALESGLATSADVLEAQTRLYTSIRDGTQARYEYLVGRMRLLVNTGTPMQQVIADVDRQLTQTTDLSRNPQP